VGTGTGAAIFLISFLGGQLSTLLRERFPESEADMDVDVGGYFDDYFERGYESEGFCESWGEFEFSELRAVGTISGQ
jgi:hypothetical protein